MPSVSLTILGSGTSTGVPIIGCRCPVCRSKHPRNQRLRASVWIQAGGKHLIVDTGPDFRAQVLRAKVPRVDAVLFTHDHADHSHGIDDVRAYNFLQKDKIPCYANPETAEGLRRKFPYVFSLESYEGGGLPKLEMRAFAPDAPEIRPAGVPVIPLDLPHGRRRTAGFRIGDLAYVVDCHDIPAEALARLAQVKTLILDCVQLKSHNTHLNLETALLLCRKVGAPRTYLTHLGHDFDDRKFPAEDLPKGVKLAYDGLTLKGNF